MRELLHFIVKSIIEDDFEIDEKEEEGHVNFTLKIPKDKMGLVIGKGGRIIKSIQDIIRVKATLEKKYVYIQVEEK